MSRWAGLSLAQGILTPQPRCHATLSQCSRTRAAQPERLKVQEGSKREIHDINKSMEGIGNCRTANWWWWEVWIRLTDLHNPLGWQFCRQLTFLYYYIPLYKECWQFLIIQKSLLLWFKISSFKSKTVFQKFYPSKLSFPVIDSCFFLRCIFFLLKRTQEGCTIMYCSTQCSIG